MSWLKKLFGPRPDTFVELLEERGALEAAIRHIDQRIGEMIRESGLRGILKHTPSEPPPRPAAPPPPSKPHPSENPVVPIDGSKLEECVDSLKGQMRKLNRKSAPPGYLENYPAAELASKGSKEKASLNVYTAAAFGNELIDAKKTQPVAITQAFPDLVLIANRVHKIRAFVRDTELVSVPTREFWLRIEELTDDILRETDRFFKSADAVTKGEPVCPPAYFGRYGSTSCPR